MKQAMHFDPTEGITIEVQDERNGNVLGWVKREGTLWRAKSAMGRDMGLYNSPHSAILDMAGSRVRTGTG